MQLIILLRIIAIQLNKKLSRDIRYFWNDQLYHFCFNSELFLRFMQQVMTLLSYLNLYFAFTASFIRSEISNTKNFVSIFMSSRCRYPSKNISNTIKVIIFMSTSCGKENGMKNIFVLDTDLFICFVSLDALFVYLCVMA